jgi:hypothetical protein
MHLKCYTIISNLLIQQAPAQIKVKSISVVKR